MNNIPEITKKEKSLADLMNRLLKEPLNPLEQKINKMEDDFLDLIDKLENIELVLSDSSAGIDKFGKVLNNIAKEQLPDLGKKIHEDIESSLRKEIANLTAAIDIITKHLTEQLDLHNEKFAEIVRTQQDIKLLFDNLEQNMTAKNASLIDNMTGNLSIAIQANLEHSESLITGLANNFDKEYEQVYRKLDDVSARNHDDVKQVLGTLNEVVSNQGMLSERISVENSTLTLAIGASEKKLNTILITLSALACVVVMYIGYDIFFLK